MPKLKICATTKDDIADIMTCERAYPQYVGSWSEAEHLSASEDSSCRHYSIFCENDEFIGFVILRGIGSADKNIELKRIALKNLEKGYGQAILKAIIKIAFSELDANRLWLDVMEYNDRARHVYTKLGFICEGKLRESCYIPGKGFCSQYIMSIIKSDLA